MVMDAYRPSDIAGADGAGLDLHDVERIVGSEINDAITYIDYDIGTERALATAYYQGQPFGNEEDGRSQVVSFDVRDTVQAILPSLLRIFTGADQIVEFVPESPQEIDQAKQASDYVDYILMQDNDGFRILYDAIKDALVRKKGIVKFWWDESTETKDLEYTGLDMLALQKVIEDVQGAQEAEVLDQGTDENGGYLKLRIKKRRDRVRIEALPPEEFLVDRRAKTLDDALFTAHRRMASISDLVAMGYDRDEVMTASVLGDELDYNLERIARNPLATVYGPRSSDDPANRRVLYVESYVRADINGDGISELVKVCTVGSAYKVLHAEPVECRPFADFDCDPEPHTFFGQSIADVTMDVQLIKSTLMRNQLDALSLSIYPRMMVEEGQANLDDVMNTEMGAIIRVNKQGAVEPLAVPNTGEAAQNLIEYYDVVKESRTGVSRASQGLSPEALQNMTATAASAQYTQSQARIELIARVMAETGLKKLFRGILRLVVENQRAERMVKLGTNWLPMDPRGWKADWDVRCNVALGAGTNQERAQVLQGVLGRQEGLLKELGPQNPLVGFTEYHNALADYMALTGNKNADRYFKDPTNQPPQPPPPPPPEAQAAQAKVQTDQARVQLDGQKFQAAQQEAAARFEFEQQAHAQKLQLEAQKLNVDQQKIQTDAMLERERIQTEAALKRQELADKMRLGIMELEAKYQTTIDAAKVDAAVDTMRIHADVAIQQMESHDVRVMAEAKDNENNEPDN